MNTYLADHSSDCNVCGFSPCVTVRDELGVARDTELCGPHFFSDRSMVNPELWNEPQEATE